VTAVKLACSKKHKRLKAHTPLCRLWTSICLFLHSFCSLRSFVCSSSSTMAGNYSGAYFTLILNWYLTHFSSKSWFKFNVSPFRCPMLCSPFEESWPQGKICCACSTFAKEKDLEAASIPFQSHVINLYCLQFFLYGHTLSSELEKAI
jgi:hypothetical protein